MELYPDQEDTRLSKIDPIGEDPSMMVPLEPKTKPKRVAKAKVKAKPKTKTRTKVKRIEDSRSRSFERLKPKTTPEPDQIGETNLTTDGKDVLLQEAKHSAVFNDQSIQELKKEMASLRQAIKQSQTKQVQTQSFYNPPQTAVNQPPQPPTVGWAQSKPTSQPLWFM